MNRSMRFCVVLIVAMTGLAPAVGAQPLWTAEAAESAYLFYGEPGRPVLSISCGQEEGETGRDETRIEVEVEPGTKPGKDEVVLRVEGDKGHKDVALTPLAIPMLAGPGAISTVIVLATEARGAAHTIIVYAAIVLTGVVSFLTLRLGEPLLTRLGKTGIKVMTRVMGLLLAAVAVQFVLSGVKEAFGI